MNEVLCPRCGHDHWEQWGDIEGQNIRCHVEVRTERGDKFCPCTLPLSSAIRAVRASEATQVVEDINGYLGGLTRSLGRLETTLNALAEVIEMRGERAP